MPELQFTHKDVLLAAHAVLAPLANDIAAEAISARTHGLDYRGYADVVAAHGEALLAEAEGVLKAILEETLEAWLADYNN